MGVSVPLAVMAVSAGIQAYGQHKSAEAASNAQKYNAQVADQNASIAAQKALWTTQEGEQAVNNSEMKTAAQTSAIKTNQAASGIEVNSGSAVDVDNSARILGKMDALTIRSNAARQAYGYQTEQVSDQNQATLDRYGAKNSIEQGKIAMAQTAVQFAGSAAGAMGGGGGASMLGSGTNSWSNYQNSNSAFGG